MTPDETTTIGRLLMELEKADQGIFDAGMAIPPHLRSKLLGHIGNVRVGLKEMVKHSKGAAR